MGDTEQQYSLEFGAVCPNCHCTQPKLSDIADSYFGGIPYCCHNSACKTPLDYWRETLTFLKGGTVPPHMGVVSLGAKYTSFRFPLQANGMFQLDLSKFGIPSDATILSLRLNPFRSNCYPLVLELGDIALRPPRQFHVYGFPMQSGLTDGIASAAVTWVHKDDETFSWSHLLEAFEAFAAGRYRSVILPAYMAFELSLTPLVEDAIKKNMSSAAAKTFRHEQHSSSAALNVVVPLLADNVGAKRMPTEIQNTINELRKLRNDIVHDGVARADVSRQEAEQYLCASVFGLEYLRYLRKRVLP